MRGHLIVISVHRRGNVVRATQLLQMQLQGINMLFHSVLDDLTDEEWTTRVLPETNLMAFDLWHTARTQDEVIQAHVRDVPEVIAQTRWVNCGTLASEGIGLHLSREQADAIARGLTRADLAAYADAVHAEILAWLGTISDDDLDVVPHMAEHLSHLPVYQHHPELLKGLLEALQGYPVWRHLSVFCIGHIRGHLEQIDLLKEQIRLPTTSPSAVTAPPPVAVPATASPAPTETVASGRRGRWPWNRR